MKGTKDNFSHDSAGYRKFRPVYPPAFYEQLLSMVTGRERAWDVATGNGQVAQVLAKHYQEVYATDISAAQLESAPQLANVHYAVGQAEQTSFPDAYFDLITVGQALHWFAFESFFAEVKRVLRPEGLFAAWGYGLLRINPAVDEVVDHFYTKVVGPYWDPERRHIDEAYGSIPFDLQETPFPGQWSIDTEFSMEQLIGYLNTWSSVRHFRQQEGSDPVAEVRPLLQETWGNSAGLPVSFPLFVRCGRK